MDIVAMGELLIDFLEIDRDAEGYPILRAQPGGAPANMLAAAAACGSQTAIIGKVGNDRFGVLLRDELDRRSIDSSGVVVDDDVFTTLAFVETDASGERSFSFARKPGSDTMLRADEIDYSLLDSARLFHFGTLSLTDEPSRSATIAAVAEARNRNLLISFDPNLRPGLWQNIDDARTAMEWGCKESSIVKLSAEEADRFWELGLDETLRRIIEEYDCDLVFCTLGSQGCRVARRGEIISVKCPKTVKAVDTTGAGDIFTGAMLSRLLAQECLAQESLSHHDAIVSLSSAALSEIASFACAMASLSTTQPGGMTSIPDPSAWTTLE